MPSSSQSAEQLWFTLLTNQERVRLATVDQLTHTHPARILQDCLTVHQHDLLALLDQLELQSLNLLQFRRHIFDLFLIQYLDELTKKEAAGA